MTPRWLFCLVVGMAAPVVQAQTQPVFAPDPAYASDSNYDPDEEVNEQPLAPTAPPALPQETPTARPFAEAVWTSGHWYWDDGQWRYKQGAWIARMPNYQFVNGYWQQEGSSYRWVPGGWAQPGSMTVEIPTEVSDEELAATQAPPQLRVESPPPAPAANYEWAPGYWYWSGSDWDWVDGSWVVPPRAGLVFVSPRWVQRGPSWHFVGGGWAMRGSVRVVVPEYRHASVSVRWGHPNYFFHSWRRYPTVHHYYYRPRHYNPSSGWSRPGSHYYPNRGGYNRGPEPSRGGYHGAGPGWSGGGDRGGYNRGGGDRGNGGYNRGGGNGGHSRGGGGGGSSGSHDASPVGGGRNH